MGTETKSYILLFSVIFSIMAIGFGFNYKPIVGMVIFISVILFWSFFPYDKYFNKWFKRKRK